MELLDFYRALLPNAGFFCLFSVPRTKHIWADSLEKLVELTERVNIEHSWYFATASFRAKSRTQDAVMGKKCFYFDIDCGREKYAANPNGAYLTRKEGVTALAQFAKATTLMPTLLVFSGAGLHAYYVLDEEISAAEWDSRAEKLGELARIHEFKVDPACTTDSARVLRPLGALHKNGNRVELLKDTGRVWTLEELDEVLGPVEVFSAPVRSDKLDVNAMLWEPTPYSAMKVAQHCAVLKDIATQRGDVQEPLWRAMLGIVKFSVEGDDQGHEWSVGHPDYDERETQRKLDKWEGTGPTLCRTFSKLSPLCEGCQYNGKISSPSQLGRMTENEIATLPEDKRPEEVVVELPKELALPLPDLGAGYRAVKGERNGWRIEYMKIVDSETPDGGRVKLKKWEVLSDDAFFVVDWSQAGVEENEPAVVVIRLHRGRTVQRFEMPTAFLGQPSKTREFLSGKSITGSDTTAEVQGKLWAYVHQQYNRAKAMMKARPIIRDRFGLQFEDDGDTSEMVCAYGKYVIRRDETIHEAMLSKRLRESAALFTIPHLPESVDGRWPASVWMDHVGPAAKQQIAFLRKWYSADEYRPAQLALMLSISSPLLVFTAASKFAAGLDLPPLGLTVSLYSSGSGKGKSSLQKVCAATYGSETAHLRGGTSQDTTVNAQFGRAGLLGTMPFFADEVTGNTPAEAAVMINRIATGHDKGRMDKEGNLRKIHNWAFVGLVSTNIPQRELIASIQKTSDALQMRLIEINCDGFADTEVAGSTAHIEWDADFRDMMTENAGAIGALLNLAILKLGHARIIPAVEACMKLAATLIPGSSQRQRFMQRGLACVLTAESIFRKVLQMPIFQRDVLIEEYAKAAQSATEFADTMHKSSLDLLRTMISDYANQIIVTQTESHKKNDGQLDEVMNRHSLRPPYVGRRVVGANKLYILADAVKSWATENQCSYNELLKAADAVGARLPVAIENGKPKLGYRVTLTKGTTLSTVWGSVYLFDESVLNEGSADVATSPNVIDLPQTPALGAERRVRVQSPT